MVDAVIAAALAGAAWYERRGMGPTDGLWFDDSWVAAGALFGHPSELLTVGSGHPGFTALLMVVDRLGGDLRDLVLPALVAGILAPALLYAACRGLDVARSISALVATVLVVAPIPLLYAGRVKVYTLDVVLMTVLIVVVPRLAPLRWRWPHAAVWVVGAVAVGSFSGPMLLATAVGGITLALHPRADRWVRVAAIGVQGLVQALWLREARRRTDLDRIEEVLHLAFDAHLRFDPNPVTFGREVLEHLRRLAEIYPGGSGAWLTLFALTSLAGLLIAAAVGRTRLEVVTGRYLVLLMTTAFVAGVADRFPFGPSNESSMSPGGRYALWMVPILAVGIAVALQRLRDLVPAVPARRVVDVGLLVAAAVVLVGSHSPAPPYPEPGSASAARFVAEEMGPDDVLFVTSSSTYSNAVAWPDGDGIDLVPSPSLEVGFTPAYDDDRILVTGGWREDPPSLRDIVEHAAQGEQVFVVASGTTGYNGLKQVTDSLTAAGYEMVDERRFESSVVSVWER